jgi:hypothetical protein
MFKVHVQGATTPSPHKASSTVTMATEGVRPHCIHDACMHSVMYSLDDRPTLHIAHTVQERQGAYLIILITFVEIINQAIRPLYADHYLT